MKEVADAADPKRQEKLLGSRSLLSRHFDAYVEAFATLNGSPKSVTQLDVYGRFLGYAAQVSKSARKDVYDSFSVLGENFDGYVDCLVGGDRATEIGDLVELFSPYWDHNLGHGKLGSAAFKAGHHETAERYLLKLRHGLEQYFRAEEMSMLADIWFAQGDDQQAHELLLDCMQQLTKEIQESKYHSDRKMFAEELLHHRATFLRLFPSKESRLVELGISAEPL